MAEWHDSTNQGSPYMPQNIILLTLRTHHKGPMIVGSPQILRTPQPYELITPTTPKPKMGVSQNRGGNFLGSDKGYSILGSISGSLSFWEMTKYYTLGHQARRQSEAEPSDLVLKGRAQHGDAEAGAQLWACS